MAWSFCSLHIDGEPNKLFEKRFSMPTRSCLRVHNALALSNVKWDARCCVSCAFPLRSAERSSVAREECRSRQSSIASLATVRPLITIEYAWPAANDGETLCAGSSVQFAYDCRGIKVWMEPNSQPSSSGSHWMACTHVSGSPLSVQQLVAFLSSHHLASALKAPERDQRSAPTGEQAV